MENILFMGAGPKSTEVTSIDQINQETLQEFLAQTSVWDFYEIKMEEYMNKSNDDKKSLILKFVNCMVAGIILLFVSLLFGVFSLLLSFQFCILRIQEHIYHAHDYFQYFHQ